MKMHWPVQDRRWGCLSVLALLFGASSVWGASPSSGSTHNVPVLELKYFSADGDGGLNLDSSITKFDYALAFARSKVADISNELITELEIKDPSGIPTLDYSIYQSIEYLAAAPKFAAFLSPNSPFLAFSDHIKMLNKLDICDYVDNKGVKEVWVWRYHADKAGGISPMESNMAMGTLSNTYWNHDTFGDVRNSYQRNDLPVCNKTYAVYTWVIKELKRYGSIIASQ